MAFDKLRLTVHWERQNVVSCIFRARKFCRTTIGAPFPARRSAST